MNTVRFAGIDWGNETHQVCVVDESGVELAQRSFQHSGAGLEALVEWLRELAGDRPEELRVAIEVPRGTVVDTLLAGGFSVYAINPKQLDRFRDRHSVAGAKDDRRDAYVLADSIRTDQKCFRRLQGDEPLIVLLRELNRMEDEIGDELRQLSNRLREILQRVFPQLLTLCPAADEAWLWDLLESTPTPRSINQATHRRAARVLRDNRIRRISEEELVSVLTSQPVTVAAGTAEACEEHIALLLPKLRLVREQRQQLSRRIESVLAKLQAQEEETEHRDVQILRSLPGVGRTVAATMLAEASQPLASRDYYALRSIAGVAPVTKASGKRSGARATVSQRQACNVHLREAVYHFARTSMQLDPASREYYRAARSRGQSHGRALRGLGDRLLRILIGMLRNQTTFDPSRSRVAPANLATVPA